MGFCIGKKACDRLDCKQRCRATLSGTPDLQYACEQLCISSDGKKPRDGNDFLSNYANKEILQEYYGLQNEKKDPAGSSYKSQQNIKMILSVAGIILAVAITLIIIMKSK